MLYRQKKFSTNSQKFCKNLVQVYTPFINSVLKNDVNNNKLNPWFVTGFTEAASACGLASPTKRKVVLVFIYIKMLIIKLVGLLV